MARASAGADEDLEWKWPTERKIIPLLPEKESPPLLVAHWLSSFFPLLLLSLLYKTFYYTLPHVIILGPPQPRRCGSVGQVCVCIVSLFPPSLSLDVYIHSRFCGQLRVQCAMGCHWDDKSPKFPLLTPAHRRRCHTHTHNRTHLRPSYPVVHQRSFRSIIIYCTFGRWSAFHLIEQRWLPCRRPSDTGKKKKRLEIHLLLYFTVLVFIILQPNIILLLVKVRVRTYRSKGRFLSLVACIMCFFLPTGFYLRRSFTSSFFLLLLLLLLLCCYFFFLIWGSRVFGRPKEKETCTNVFDQLFFQRSGSCFPFCSRELDIYKTLCRGEFSCRAKVGWETRMDIYLMD